MRRSETLTKQSPWPASRLAILIAELNRRVQLIEADIQAEEKRSNVFDLSSPEYRELARHLRARRDNLLATISLLEARRPAAAA